MWKATKKIIGMEPLAGVPWEDMSDKRFAEVAAEYDAQFEPGALANSGFFAHVKDEKPAKEPD